VCTLRSKDASLIWNYTKLLLCATGHKMQHWQLIYGKRCSDGKELINRHRVSACFVITSSARVLPRLSFEVEWIRWFRQRQLPFKTLNCQIFRGTPKPSVTWNHVRSSWVINFLDANCRRSPLTVAWYWGNRRVLMISYLCLCLQETVDKCLVKCI